MAEDRTDRLALPLLMAGQAQKEVTHNEALLRLEIAACASVKSADITVPPGAPTGGQCWIVAAGGTGAWAGRGEHLATWTAGGWRFAAPVAGMRVWIRTLSLWVHWTGSAWSDGAVLGSRLVIDGQQVVGKRSGAVPSPSGGTIIDAEARAAVDAVIVALRTHGLID